jgi:hypothetical protein
VLIALTVYSHSDSDPDYGAPQRFARSAIPASNASVSSVASANVRNVVVVPASAMPSARQAPIAP